MQARGRLNIFALGAKSLCMHVHSFQASCAAFACAVKLVAPNCQQFGFFNPCVLGLGDAIQALMLHLFALAATTRRRFSICIRKLDLYFARPDYTEALVCFSLL